MQTAVDFANLDRCSAYGFESGRCQLAAGHDGPHAVRIDDAFLTWDLQRMSHWSGRHPASWLFDLPWVTGLPPSLLTAPSTILADS